MAGDAVGAVIIRRGYRLVLSGGGKNHIIGGHIEDPTDDRVFFCKVISCPRRCARCLFTYGNFLVFAILLNASVLFIIQQVGYSVRGLFPSFFVLRDVCDIPGHFLGNLRFPSDELIDISIAHLSGVRDHRRVIAIVQSPILQRDIGGAGLLNGAAVQVVRYSIGLFALCRELALDDHIILGNLDRSILQISVDIGLIGIPAVEIIPIQRVFRRHGHFRAVLVRLGLRQFRRVLGDGPLVLIPHGVPGPVIVHLQNQLAVSGDGAGLIRLLLVESEAFVFLDFSRSSFSDSARGCQCIIFNNRVVIIFQILLIVLYPIVGHRGFPLGVQDHIGVFDGDGIPSLIGCSGAIRRSVPPGKLMSGPRKSITEHRGLAAGDVVFGVRDCACSLTGIFIIGHRIRGHRRFGGVGQAGGIFIILTILQPGFAAFCSAIGIIIAGYSPIGAIHVRLDIKDYTQFIALPGVLLSIVNNAVFITGIVKPCDLNIFSAHRYIDLICDVNRIAPSTCILITAGGRDPINGDTMHDAAVAAYHHAVAEREILRQRICQDRGCADLNRAADISGDGLEDVVKFPLITGAHGILVCSLISA